MSIALPFRIAFSIAWFARASAAVLPDDAAECVLLVRGAGVLAVAGPVPALRRSVEPLGSGKE
jgi:hypothetical protein